MKIHAILLIALPMLMVCYGQIDLRCTPCNWKRSFYCGKEADGGCMVTTINKCMAEMLSCLREHKGLKPFMEIVKGKCPKGQRKCLPYI